MTSSSLVRSLSLAGVIACAGETAVAQTAVPPPTPAPCRATEYRQFDFWVGDWDVRTPDGKPAGSNRIERILGGCALRETWKGAIGTNGTSLNSWDPGTRRWHQTWVGDDGVLLKLEGGLRAGKMVLLGETVSANGERALQRITWSTMAGGRVRQYWEQSSDAGKTWAIAFEGIYSPQPK